MLQKRAAGAWAPFRLKNLKCEFDAQEEEGIPHEVLNA